MFSKPCFRNGVGKEQYSLRIGSGIATLSWEATLAVGQPSNMEESPRQFAKHKEEVKMKTATFFLITMALILSWSSIPALAQRGQGRGPGGGAPAVGSWPQGGPGASGSHGGTIGSQSGREPNRPDIGQRGTGRPEARPDDHANTRADHRPDAGQRTPAEHLAANPKLSSKLEKFFPAGTNLQQEAAGFKNLGEFVAATHVSHNLGIPFDQLRTRMATGKSLGDAIHDLKPEVNHRAEEKKAREQARKDLREAEAGS